MSVTRQFAPVIMDKIMCVAQLVDVDELDPSILLDIRYATKNNFLGRRVYSQARALLQLPVAEALVAAHHSLTAAGFGIVIFDAYRPASVTKLFWDWASASQRPFVANPKFGSNHNRGCSADISIYHLFTKQLADMPSGFDEMTERAAADYAGCSELQRQNRQLLRNTAESHGFTVHPLEWWHFDHALSARYPILDIPFEDIPRSKQHPT